MWSAPPGEWDERQVGGTNGGGGSGARQDEGPIATAHAQHAARIQVNLEVAVRAAGDLAHVIQIDEGRAVDAAEALRVEIVFEIGERATHQVRAAAGVYLDVVSGRAQPLDF